MTRALLELILTAHTDTARLASLIKAIPWQDDRILQWCNDHRIGPYLWYLAKRANCTDSINSELRDLLKRKYLKSVRRSLVLQAELLNLADALEASNTPYVVLKGPLLAFEFYPEAALRPMRDIDFLVPHQDALSCFNALLDRGYRRIPTELGNPETALSNDKHMPPIQNGAMNLRLEQHQRLLSPSYLSGRTDLSDDKTFWEKTAKLTVASRILPAENASFLLFHLIIHAVREHALDNGPLTLLDVNFLLASQKVDWTYFEALVTRYNAYREVNFIFQLLKIYSRQDAVLSQIPQQFQMEALPNHIVDAATALLFERFSRRGLRDKSARISGSRTLKAKAKVLFLIIFLSREEVARRTGILATSPKVFLCYPRIWASMLTRLPELLNMSLSRQHGLDGTNARLLFNEFFTANKH